GGRSGAAGSMAAGGFAAPGAARGLSLGGDVGAGANRLQDGSALDRHPGLDSAAERGAAGTAVGSAIRQAPARIRFSSGFSASARDREAARGRTLAGLELSSRRPGRLEHGARVLRGLEGLPLARARAAAPIARAVAALHGLSRMAPRSRWRGSGSLL